MSTIYDYLIGEEVYYKSKSSVKGRIVCFKQTSDEMFVHISLSDSSDEVKKLLFPFSFFRNTLYSESSTIANALKNISCKVCGVPDNCVKFANNNHYCKKCYSELVECIHCNNKIHPSNAYRKDYNYFSRKYDYVCGECNHDYKICPECNAIYFLPERIECFPKIPKSNQECISCLEDKCLQCSNCAEMFLPDDMIIKDYLQICKACFDNSTYICPSCGRIAIKRKTEYDSCDKQEICGKCKENEHYIEYCKKLLTRITTSKASRAMIDFKILKNTSHSKLIDRLSHCSEPYIDALLIHFDDFILVLAFNNTSTPEKNYLQNNYSGSMTMTNFKSTRAYYWRGIVYETPNSQIIQEGNFKFHIWKNPYKIRAVTSRDKDFRKEYYGDYLEYEGNNYGDTSDFFIIGSIHND